MTRTPRSDPTVPATHGTEGTARSLLREMRGQDVLPLWSNGFVEAGRQLIDHGLARQVDSIATYATLPRMAIQITDEGRKVRLREPRT